MYYVYILRSIVDKKFYTGKTNNLKRRFEEHNEGKVISTKHRRPFNLVYCEYCLSSIDADRREKYLKTAWGKRYIKNRIKDYLKMQDKSRLNFIYFIQDYLVKLGMINEEIKEKIIRVMKEENIPYAGIFGSYAKGTANENSDVDILINLGEKHNFSLFDMVRIENNLKIILNRDVDLVTPEDLSKYYREDVVKSVIKIYGN